MPRIYAAGDVANPIHPSVVAALADGALAARAVAYDCGSG
jgi:thioredoxin reductase